MVSNNYIDNICYGMVTTGSFVYGLVKQEPDAILFGSLVAMLWTSYNTHQIERSALKSRISHLEKKINDYDSNKD